MAERPLRVLFLTRYPVEGASSRYRVFQYLSHLRALGVQCEVQSFMDADMYRISFQPGGTLRKLWQTLQATFRRVRAVAGHRRYDIVYLQRELLPFGPPLLERWMKRRGARLLFDYDDALFIHKPSRYNPLAGFLRAPGKVVELFGLVDCVVAGNDWLRDEALRLGAVRAVTLEVAEDTGRIRLRTPAPDAPLTIGWLGSTSTVKYLQLIAPVLRDIAQRHPQVRFEIMGGGAFAMPGVPWVLSAWSLEAELAALARFDIGLMPLPMEDWAKGKSGGKARTYMAAGVVPVCADIGYNRELIRHGETGFLCSEPAHWQAVLESLIASPDLRRKVALAARAEVETRFAPDGKARELQALFASLCAGNTVG